MLLSSQIFMFHKHVLAFLSEIWDLKWCPEIKVNTDYKAREFSYSTLLNS